jgi:hypothetical protein
MFRYAESFYMHLCNLKTAVCNRQVNEQSRPAQPDLSQPRRRKSARQLHTNCNLTPRLKRAITRETTTLFVAGGTISGFLAALPYMMPMVRMAWEIPAAQQRFGFSRTSEVERHDQARVSWLRSLCGEKSKSKSATRTFCLAACLSLRAWGLVGSSSF